MAELSSPTDNSNKRCIGEMDGSVWSYGLTPNTLEAIGSTLTPSEARTARQVCKYWREHIAAAHTRWSLFAPLNLSTNTYDLRKPTPWPGALELSYTRSGQQLLNLLQYLPNMRDPRLVVSSKVSQPAYVELMNVMSRNCRGLRSLDLTVFTATKNAARMNPFVLAKFVKPLAAFHNLTQLSISAGHSNILEIQSSDLLHLSALGSLTSLTFSSFPKRFGRQPGMVLFSALTPLTGLRHLSIDMERVFWVNTTTEYGVTQLTKLVSLEDLSLTHGVLADEHVAALCRLPQLRKLVCCPELGWSSDLLRAVSIAPKLEDVRWSYMVAPSVTMSDDALAALLACTRVVGAAVSVAGHQLNRLAATAHLQELHISLTGMEDFASDEDEDSSSDEDMVVANPLEHFLHAVAHAHAAAEAAAQAEHMQSQAAMQAAAQVQHMQAQASAQAEYMQALAAAHAAAQELQTQAQADAAVEVQIAAVAHGSSSGAAQEGCSGWGGGPDTGNGGEGLVASGALNASGSALAEVGVADVPRMDANVGGSSNPPHTSGVSDAAPRTGSGLEPPVLNHLHSAAFLRGAATTAAHILTGDASYGVAHAPGVEPPQAYSAFEAQPHPTLAAALPAHGAAVPAPGVVVPLATSTAPCLAPALGDSMAPLNITGNLVTSAGSSGGSAPGHAASVSGSQEEEEEVAPAAPSTDDDESVWSDDSLTEAVLADAQAQVTVQDPDMGFILAEDTVLVMRTQMQECLRNLVRLVLSCNPVWFDGASGGPSVTLTEWFLDALPGCCSELRTLELQNLMVPRTALFLLSFCAQLDSLALRHVGVSGGGLLLGPLPPRLVSLRVDTSLDKCSRLLVQSHAPSPCLALLHLRHCELLGGQFNILMGRVPGLRSLVLDTLGWPAASDLAALSRLAQLTELKFYHSKAHDALQLADQMTALSSLHSLRMLTWSQPSTRPLEPRNMEVLQNLHCLHLASLGHASAAAKQRLRDITSHLPFCTTT